MGVELRVTSMNRERIINKLIDFGFTEEEAEKNADGIETMSQEIALKPISPEDKK